MMFVRDIHSTLVALVVKHSLWWGIEVENATSTTAVAAGSSDVVLAIQNYCSINSCKSCLYSYTRYT